MSDKTVGTKLKTQVKERANYCCEYCISQEDYSPDVFSVEHIIARVKGGTNQSDNLANACQGCNNHKYTNIEAIDSLTGEIVSLYHPRHDHWHEHFGWNEDCTLIIGITPTGRATVEKLNLNRKGVVNLRRVLYQLGLHPPGIIPIPS